MACRSVKPPNPPGLRRAESWRLFFGNELGDHVFTLGIEEEFQIIDPETRELRSHIQQILGEGKVTLNEQIKPEMHQSVVELGTDVCGDIRDAREQVIRLRSELATMAGAERVEDRLRRHPSVLALVRPAHHRGRTLRHDREGHAAGRARQPHLRPARPCRHSRPRRSRSTL